ncbi:MAG TPA: hypothetical protein VEL51_07565 [Vicinamibacterales bacterium]|nr:hypothetical protein [Vicinamibacterales bacterium]
MEDLAAVHAAILRQRFLRGRGARFGGSGFFSSALAGTPGVLGQEWR